LRGGVPIILVTLIGLIVKPMLLNVRYSLWIFLLGLLTVGLLACNNETDDTPPGPTLSEQYDFWAEKDGNLWVPTGQFAFYDTVLNRLTIYAYRNTGPFAREALYLNLEGPLQPGDYTPASGLSASWTFNDSESVALPEAQLTITRSANGQIFGNFSAAAANNGQPSLLGGNFEQLQVLPEGPTDTTGYLRAFWSAAFWAAQSRSVTRVGNQLTLQGSGLFEGALCPLTLTINLPVGQLGTFQVSQNTLGGSIQLGLGQTYFFTQGSIIFVRNDSSLVSGLFSGTFQNPVSGQQLSVWEGVFYNLRVQY
jgi:hypothetical protein